MNITTQIDLGTRLRRTPCLCCHSRDRPGHGYVTVQCDGENVGIVCEDCVRAGPDKVVERLRAKADDLHKHADFLEKVAANGISLPSVSDLEAGQHAAEEEYMEHF